MTGLLLLQAEFLTRSLDPFYQLVVSPSVSPYLCFLLMARPLVAMTTAMVEEERRAATARLRGTLSSCFFSQVPCVYHWAGERIQEGVGE